MLKDEDGQPVARFGFLRDNNLSKAFDQLNGICKGILCDGIITDTEARFFYEWVKTHANADTVWPFGQILARLNSIFSDGVVTEDEREDLAAIMQQITGGAEAAEPAKEDTSSALPLDDPAPTVIEFPGREFSVTGRFAFGTRKKIVEAITQREGEFNDDPRGSTDYLLVGFFASRDWKFSAYGNKISRALRLRTDSGRIKIVAEEHWKKFVV